MWLKNTHEGDLLVPFLLWYLNVLSRSFYFTCCILMVFSVNYSWHYSIYTPHRLALKSKTSPPGRIYNQCGCQLVPRLLWWNTASPRSGNDRKHCSSLANGDPFLTSVSSLQSVLAVSSRSASYSKFHQLHLFLYLKNLLVSIRPDDLCSNF